MKTVTSEVAAEIPKNYLRLCPRCGTAGQSAGTHENEVPPFQGAPYVSSYVSCAYVSWASNTENKLRPLSYNLSTRKGDGAA